jgi:Co/Zn/Cd efflux system component
MAAEVLTSPMSGARHRRGAARWVVLVGAVLVAMWAKGLLLQTGRVLLDREMDHPVVDEIREGVEHGLADSETRVADLHVWRVGRNAYSCALTVVTHSPTLDAAAVRATFSMHEEIVHSTVEVQRCAGDEPTLAFGAAGPISRA